MNSEQNYTESRGIILVLLLLIWNVQSSISVTVTASPYCSISVFADYFKALN
jgi:hypothetical protein